MIAIYKFDGHPYSEARSTAFNYSNMKLVGQWTGPGQSFHQELSPFGVFVLEKWSTFGEFVGKDLMDLVVYLNSSWWDERLSFRSTPTNRMDVFSCEIDPKIFWIIIAEAFVAKQSLVTHQADDRCHPIRLWIIVGCCLPGVSVFNLDLEIESINHRFLICLVSFMNTYLHADADIWCPSIT